MNREEAIMELESLRQFLIGKPFFDKEDNKAFDMAIEALEKIEYLEKQLGGGEE